MTDTREVRRRAARRTGWRIRSGDALILLLLAGGIATFFRASSPAALIDLLYSPTAGLILIIMVVEFLWLKSGDRTRIYALEIERLREQRRHDEDLLRRARNLVDQAVNLPESEEKGRPGDWRQRALDAVKDIDQRL